MSKTPEPEIPNNPAPTRKDAETAKSPAGRSPGKGKAATTSRSEPRPADMPSTTADAPARSHSR